MVDCIEDIPAQPVWQRPNDIALDNNHATKNEARFFWYNLF